MPVPPRQRGDDDDGRHHCARRHDSKVTRVLFVHTATAPPLGADTWVHTEVMANLDPETHEIHAACVVGEGTRTPTYETLRAIPGVLIQPTNLGVETVSGSPLQRARQTVATIPKLVELVRLARY